MYQVDGGTKIEDLPFYQVLEFDIHMRLHAAREMIKEGYQLTLLPDGPAVLGETFKEDEAFIDRLFASTEQRKGIDQTEKWLVIRNSVLCFQ